MNIHIELQKAQNLKIKGADIKQNNADVKKAPKQTD